MVNTFNYLEQIIGLAKQIDIENQQKLVKMGFMPADGTDPMVFHLENFKNLLTYESGQLPKDITLFKCIKLCFKALRVQRELRKGKLLK
jgi:hypothetical protein